MPESLKVLRRRIRSISNTKQVTRAMEVMRGIARGLPDDMVATYLSTHEAHATLELFAREHARILGAPPGVPPGAPART